MRVIHEVLADLLFLDGDNAEIAAANRRLRTLHHKHNIPYYTIAASNETGEPRYIIMTTPTEATLSDIETNETFDITNLIDNELRAA